MKFKLFCLGLGLIMLLGGCSSAPSKSPQEYSQTIFAMDTAMTLTAYGEGCEAAVDAAINEINRLDALFSVNNENSDIYRLNSEKTAQVSDDTYSLLGSALDFYEKTDGALDAAVYPAVKAWGFTTGEHRVPDESDLSELKTHVNAENVVLGKNNTVTLTDSLAEVDLGSVAKGYASDLVCNIMKDTGITSGIVSLGGNVETIGVKTDGSLWKIGVTDPSDESSLIGTLSLENKAVITSGSYQRYFDLEGVRYHHIIDPETCAPARSGLTSVTIVSDSGLTADAYSTAVFVMGLEKGSEFWRNSPDSFDIVFITDEGEVYITEGLKDAFVPRDDIEPNIIEDN
ncbi:MAG: FAD:protein FMN transferase [Clostridiales bacterium]|nr:FAD:protein FMN transferase [Clostridiales bacterium]